MRGRHLLITGLTLVIINTLGQLSAQALLEPPFGLRWGDSPEKLLAWATRQALDLTVTQPGDQPALRIVHIAPRRGLLPESKAAALEGRFLAGQLFEVTVHYTDRDASADQMETRFNALRNQLTQEHGSLRPDQQQRSVADQFVTRTQSYHREPIKGLFLLLACTEVEDLLRKTRDLRFSLIYRNDNFRAELLQKLKQP